MSKNQKTKKSKATSKTKSKGLKASKSPLKKPKSSATTRPMAKTKLAKSGATKKKTGQSKSKASASSKNPISKALAKAPRNQMLVVHPETKEVLAKVSVEFHGPAQFGFVIESLLTDKISVDAPVQIKPTPANAGFTDPVDNRIAADEENIIGSGSPLSVEETANTDLGLDESFAHDEDEGYF